MKTPVIIPALADLRQDIAGVVPVELIRAWVESDRTQATHSRLLTRYARKGTVVKTDSSGLSKLTAARPLIEVLKLVNEPKELIAAHGLAIGGEAIGTWIADDTEMFYPDHIPTDTVIDAMAAVQRANAKNLVQVGMAVQRGEFFHIGNGLFGEHADIVEHVAEEETGGGEIWLAHPKQRIDHVALNPKTQPLAEFQYPAPFSREFLQELRAYTPERAADITAKYAHDLCVILVRVFHPHQELLLNHISSYTSANSDIIKTAEQYRVSKIKSNGALAIFTAKTVDEGAHFAQAMREALRYDAWTCNVAVTKGPVFLFPLEHGAIEIAGGPVNVASKLAEDTEERDAIFLEDSAASEFPHQGERFELMRSGVQLSGVRL